MPTLPPEFRALLARQDGVATRRQLLGHGVTRDAICWNAGRNWRVLLPGTYLVGSGRPTDRQRFIAALAYAGPDSVLAGATAVRRYGLTSLGPSRSARVDVLVPWPQSSRHVGYVWIRRTRLDDEVRVQGPLRLSSPARSCVDTAVDLRRPQDRSALFIEAVQRRVTALADLAEWTYRLRPRDGRHLLSALDAAGGGAWSVPEHDLRQLLAADGRLPDPWPNPVLVDGNGNPLLTPDLWFDDVALAVMVHSRQYHSNGKQFTDTIERDGELVAAGVVVIGVTPSGQRDDPEAVISRIIKAYAVASRRSRPPVRATPRVAS